MAFPGFTPADFKVFDIDGFTPRMEAIRTRIRPKLEMTSTFKQMKGNLVRQGFNPKASSDPIYFSDPQTKSYVRLDFPLYQRIENGDIRLWPCQPKRCWRSGATRAPTSGSRRTPRSTTRSARGFFRPTRPRRAGSLPAGSRRAKGHSRSSSRSINSRAVCVPINPAPVIKTRIDASALRSVQGLMIYKSLPLLHPPPRRGGGKRWGLNFER